MIAPLANTKVLILVTWPVYCCHEAVVVAAGNPVNKNVIIITRRARCSQQIKVKENASEDHEKTPQGRVYAG